MARKPNTTKFQSFLKKLLASESGASMLEYALLAFLVGVVLIGALEAIGISISDIMGSLSGTMEGANPGTGD